jgi:uncharacterized membrane protein (DUF485 family)
MDNQEQFVSIKKKERRFKTILLIIFFTKSYFSIII